MSKSTIQSPSDVKVLIKIFYVKLLQSEIKYIFANLDLAIHLPHVEAFWNATLFPEFAYHNNLLEKHTQLNLKQEDFKIWLQLFCETVDELFEGPNAETTKNRAHSMHI